MLDPLSITIESPRTQASPPRPDLPTRKLLQASSEHPDDYVLEIDNSSLEKFTTCPRAAENYLIHSREAAGSSSAQNFGRLFHKCEEIRLLHGLSEATKTAQKEEVMSHFLSHPVPPDDHRTADRMLAILKVYNDRYAQDGWPESVLTDAEGVKFVERPFKVQLCTLPINATLPFNGSQLLPKDAGWRSNDFEGSDVIIRNLHILYTGRIDVILRERSSGQLWVVDHKTSSIGGKTYYEDFRLSSQTVGYCWAAQKVLQQPVSGLLLNALIIRPLTKTGIGQEFTRNNFFYSPNRLEEWEQNVKTIVTDFVANLVRGYFPQHTKACMGKYGICQYHENCSLPRQQRPSDLASDLFRSVTWNPTHE